jgi:hypothetical protein
METDTAPPRRNDALVLGGMRAARSTSMRFTEPRGHTEEQPAPPRRTEIRCSKIVDSSRWGKRARHHCQKSTTKIHAKKSSQMHECKLRLNKCISPKFFFPWCKTPPGNMNWVLPPLLVMHESSLQIQACVSQIYKEHYNVLKLRHRQAR